MTVDGGRWYPGALLIGRSDPWERYWDVVSSCGHTERKVEAAKVQIDRFLGKNEASIAADIQHRQQKF